MKNSNRYRMANAAVAFAGDSTEASTEAASEQLKGDPDISADIVVGGWPSGDDAFKAALPGFNKLYPNINVEFQFTDTTSYHQNLATSLAAGSGAPDVAMVEGAYVAQYRNSSALEQPYIFTSSLLKEISSRAPSAW